MAYIYKIVNQINGKVYIGKTLLTPEERFKQHCRDCYKPRNDKRPLYVAMNKYGIENFKLFTIEECSDKIVNEREVYWIEFYQSFKNGYNATIGGDGKTYLDYDLICATYKELLNANDVAKKLKISQDSVYKVLKNRGIKIKSPQEISRDNFSKKIDMLDKDGNYLKSFSSLTEASQYIKESQNKEGDLKGIGVHLRNVANGKRKTAYGYKWQWHLK